MNFPLRRLACVFSLILTALLFPACESTPKENPNFPILQAPSPTDLYRLRVGDIVQVDVFQEPLMTMRQRIQGDGTISVALIGRIRVTGMSIEGAAAEIGDRLNKKQLVTPQVTMTVLAYAPRRFTVWGQVKSAGTFVIPPEESMTLPEAIAMAGGNTIIGNPRKAVVSRKTANGEVERIQVDSQSPEAQSFLVAEGDVIYIPETAF